MLADTGHRPFIPHGVEARLFFPTREGTKGLSRVNAWACISEDLSHGGKSSFLKSSLLSCCRFHSCTVMESAAASNSGAKHTSV